MWFALACTATGLWAIANTADSVVVKSYEKDPRVILFVHNAMALVALAGISLFTSVQTPWAAMLFIAGMTIYLGDYFYIKLIDDIDISTINAAWALHAIYLSIAGIVLFNENWSALQGIGVVCALGGVLLLSYWHRLGSLRRTFGRYACLALLYVPVYVLRKMAVDDAVLPIVAFFWSTLGFALTAVTVPFIRTSVRTSVFTSLKREASLFYVIVFVGLTANLLASYLVTEAYVTGPLSLISVVVNAHPFFVMIIAWILFRLAPQFSPREVLTRQSVQTKAVSFVLVAIGLILLATA
jgi:drug/metabolite transporter (DMT)-like permease